jgi:hypothetical protein
MMKRLSKQEEQDITAVLLVGQMALLGSLGLLTIIGSDAMMTLGMVIAGVYVFFLIGVPLIVRLVVCLIVYITDRGKQ